MSFTFVLCSCKDTTYYSIAVRIQREENLFDGYEFIWWLNSLMFLIVHIHVSYVIVHIHMLKDLFTNCDI